MRKAQIFRETDETKIKLEINLDGKGQADINVPFPFLEHMLKTFSKHSFCDLYLTAQGDTHVDIHHLIEDIGIVLGIAIDKALDNKQGIERYGFFILPMDETLVEVCLDLSGRPYFVWQGFPKFINFLGYEFDIWREFFKSLAFFGKFNLHVNLKYGQNIHHIIEATFKAFAKSFKIAKSISNTEIPSTKGSL